MRITQDTHRPQRASEGKALYTGDVGATRRYNGLRWRWLRNGSHGKHIQQHQDATGDAALNVGSVRRAGSTGAAGRRRRRAARHTTAPECYALLYILDI